MKKLSILLLIFLCTVQAQTDDTRYINAMKKNIVQIDSLNRPEDFIDLANTFYRIGKAEKEKWLPFYYASYVYTLASFADSTTTKKDLYLDQAEVYFAFADSLNPDDSEIYTLKGLIMIGRLQVDPMSRFMKYGGEMNIAFQKAQLLDPTNPRPDYLMAMITLYTPEQFGGGAKIAKPMLEKAIQKFDEFVPKDELMPLWGRNQAEGILKNIP